MRLILALMMVLAAVPAHAHSELRGSDPARQAVLAQSPPAVVVTFNEPVQVTTLRLKNAANAVIRLQVDGGFEPATSKRARVIEPLPPGRYVIDWAAISADGHPIGGTIPFSIRGTP